jgi:hypothetical protein
MRFSITLEMKLLELTTIVIFVAWAGRRTNRQGRAPNRGQKLGRGPGAILRKVPFNKPMVTIRHGHVLQ